MFLIRFRILAFGFLLDMLTKIERYMYANRCHLKVRDHGMSFN